MFSRKKWVGVAAGILAMSAAVCSNGWGATGGSHYQYGVEGVLGATAPPPGWHYRMYNLWYNPDMYNDSPIPGAHFGLDTFASVQRIIHVTNVKILGADYLYDVLIPFVDTDFTLGPISDSHSFSLGDVTVEPFVLGWHQSRWDATVGLGVVMPTGHFKGDEPASPGLGYWSGLITVGASYYFDEQKTWSASVLTRTLINGEQDDTDITPGSEFVVEWGVGKEFRPNNWMIRPGITGASYWQISDDSSESLSADQHKEAHAIGAEVNFFYLPMLFQVNLRYLQEYGVENGPEDSRFIATLTKSF
ncbi:MAG: transporter [Desulfobulbus sp.]|nr:transporter [Desulfobulbus sp.]